VLGTREIGAAADLYALGCVGYWYLTGELVFEGQTVMEIMMHHAKTDPPPPSSRAELDIPPELDDTILACLEKNPDKRPASAEALGAMLAEVPIADPWTRERAATWWERHHPRAMI
jgi:serine/threonine-protein kinase